MKKIFIFMAFLTTVFFNGNVNATSFTVVNSSFHISGSIIACPWEGPDPCFVYDEYDEYSSAPLSDAIILEGDSINSSVEALSEATFNRVYDNSQSGPRGDMNPDGYLEAYDCTAGSSASTYVQFKPNFSGVNTPIIFNFEHDSSSVGSYLNASIFDLTSGVAMFETTAYSPGSIFESMPVNGVASFSIAGLETSQIALSLIYSEWDLDHIYELNMSVEDGHWGAYDWAFSSIANNIEFVPEPATMLLLGSGLLGLAGLRRKFRKR